MRIFKGHMRQVAAASFAFGIAAVAAWPGTPSPSGYVEAPSSRTFMTSVLHASFFDTYTQQGLKIHRNPELRPAQDVSRFHDDPATVYLWVTDKETGSPISSGSGTIIRGEHDTHRVLTAFHTLNRGASPQDLSVTAFSATGRAIATLSYVEAALASETVAPKRNVRDVGFVAGDQAVLAVDTLMGGETAESWNARGVDLAPAQPETFLVLAPAAQDTSLSPGMSGGSVRNSAGQVVATVAMASGTAPENPEPKPVNLSLVRSAEAHFGGRYSQENAEMSNAVAVAVPVVHPRVLDALGVQARPEKVLEAFEAEVFGFPGGYAVRTGVYASQLGNVRVTPHFSQDSLRP